MRVSYLFKLCGDHPLAQMMFQALTLDFKKRCVLESSPYMSMYVRRGKSSIPSTFSDILDKSFLNEQTSLCFPKGKEKKLDRKWKLFSLNFIVESTSLHIK